MMQSAHSTPSPAPGATAEEEVYDDPPLDDLALGSGSGSDNEGDGSENNNAAAAVADAEADPWAVLAAAAGEEPPKPAPPAAAPTAVDTTSASAAAPVDASATATTTLAHAEGETFAMPDAAASDRPSLITNIQSSTAHLTSTINAKLQEVDANIGLSIKARDVNEQYHISEKWNEFNETVVKPTTAKTVEKTKEVSSTVKVVVDEKVRPSVKESWGSLRQRSTEMGIAAKWSSLSSKVGDKWNETREKTAESVEHWREEQEKRRALANANGSSNGASGAGGLAPQLEGAKEKVVEGWTGGVSWVSQRIQEAKEQRQQPSNGGTGDKEMSRLDSDGLPSSFRRGG